LKNNEITLKRLKDINQSLLKEKNNLQNDIKKHSLWKREKIDKFNKIMN
jgi:hypothetical protein